MSYALMWIEALITALVFAALLIACSAKVRRQAWPRRIFIPVLVPLAVLLPLLIPLAIFGLAAAYTGMLKFRFEIEHNWFAYSLSLLAAYLVGVFVLYVVRHNAKPADPSIAMDSWPIPKLAIGFLTALAVTSMTLWNMDLEMRSRASTLRAEAGAMLLSVSPPMVNDSRNGAIIYRKAFARLARADTWSWEKDHWEYPLDSKTPQNDPRAVEILKRQAFTLKLLREGAAMPDARFDHDYAHPNFSMILMPEMNQARHAILLLKPSARYEASQGNIEVALEDINAMFSLSKAVGDVPLFSTLFTWAGLDGIAIETLADVLPEVTNENQLKKLDAGFILLNPDIGVRNLRGEEAFGLSRFGDFMSGEVTLSDDPKKNPFDAPTTYLINSPGRILMSVFLIPDDVAGYRSLLEGYQVAATAPYYQSGTFGGDKKAIKRIGVVTAATTGLLERTMFTIAQAQALHAEANIALAMTRYRLAHGTYPDSLDKLVPEFLDEVPSDPFDGKPIRLLHKEDSWIIYSIGPQTEMFGVHPYDPKTQTGDITVVLRAMK